jgi:hypothetical protein
MHRRLEVDVIDFPLMQLCPSDVAGPSTQGTSTSQFQRYEGQRSARILIILPPQQTTTRRERSIFDISPRLYPPSYPLFPSPSLSSLDPSSSLSAQVHPALAPPSPRSGKYTFHFELYQDGQAIDTR